MASMDDYAQMQQARRLLESDEVSRRALDLLRRKSGAPGWAIAKTLDEDPDAVGKALTDLRRVGLVDTESGSGLEGFYFLTALAYRLMSSAA